MPHCKGHPTIITPLTPTEPVFSSHQSLPSRLHERKLTGSEGFNDICFLRSSCKANDPTSRPPTALQPPSQHRRYPKLLITDKDGNLIANPLTTPFNNPAPDPLNIPHPSVPFTSQSTTMSSPNPPETCITIDPSNTPYDRRCHCEPATCMAGSDPLSVTHFLTDNNSSRLSSAFRPQPPIKIIQNPMDEVRLSPHVADRIVRNDRAQERRKGGGEAKGAVRAEEERSCGPIFIGARKGGEVCVTVTNEGEGKVAILREQGKAAPRNDSVKEQARQRDESSTEKMLDGKRKLGSVGRSPEEESERNRLGEDRGGEKTKVFDEALAGGTETRKVLNPTSNAVRPLKRRTSRTKVGEDGAVEGDERISPGRTLLERPFCKRKTTTFIRGQIEFLKAIKGLGKSGFEQTALGKAGRSVRLRNNPSTGRSTGFGAGSESSSSANSLGYGLNAGTRASQSVREDRKGDHADREPEETKGVEAPNALEKERNKLERICLAKNYEFQKLEDFAESRYHVKMTLKERKKLENGLSSEDRVVFNSVLFIVLLVNFDRRLVSQEDRERREVLADMRNEHLRMLEALMARLSTTDGYTNWKVLTANFRGNRTTWQQG